MNRQRGQANYYFEMIGQKKFSWAMVLALIAVLFFAYIAFLGMQYHEMSESNTPICYAIGILLIVSLCCFGMCYGRATRNKLLGGGVQIFLGIIIFVTLVKLQAHVLPTSMAMVTQTFS